MGPAFEEGRHYVRDNVVQLICAIGLHQGLAHDEHFNKGYHLREDFTNHTAEQWVYRLTISRN